jgi:hypothetical protein
MTCDLDNKFLYLLFNSAISLSKKNISLDISDSLQIIRIIRKNTLYIYGDIEQVYHEAQNI